MASAVEGGAEKDGALLLGRQGHNGVSVQHWVVVQYHDAVLVHHGAAAGPRVLEAAVGPRACGALAAVAPALGRVVEGAPVPGAALAILAVLGHGVGVGVAREGVSSQSVCPKPAIGSVGRRRIIYVHCGGVAGNESQLARYRYAKMA